MQEDNEPDNELKEVFINEPKKIYNQYKDKFSWKSVLGVMVLAIAIIVFIQQDQDRDQRIAGLDAELGLNNLETTQQDIKDRCLKITNLMMEKLADNDGFNLRNGYAVRSNAFVDEFYFLSAEAYNSGGLGIDGEILTWFADDYFSPGYINAVGAFGEAYSSWGSNLVDQGTPYDDGYSESRDCVK
jgi:hypothetical protein